MLCSSLAHIHCCLLQWAVLLRTELPSRGLALSAMTTWPWSLLCLAPAALSLSLTPALPGTQPPRREAILSCLHDVLESGSSCVAPLWTSAAGSAPQLSQSVLPTTRCPRALEPSGDPPSIVRPRRGIHCLLTQQMTLNTGCALVSDDGQL